MKEESKEKIACAAVYACLGGTAAMITLAVIAQRRKESGELFQSILQGLIQVGKWINTMSESTMAALLAACACFLWIWSWGTYIKTLRKRMAAKGWLQAMKGAGIAVLSGVAFALGAWMLFQTAKDLVWCLSLI